MHFSSTWRKICTYISSLDVGLTFYSCVLHDKHDITCIMWYCKMWFFFFVLFFCFLFFFLSQDHVGRNYIISIVPFSLFSAAVERQSELIHTIVHKNIAQFGNIFKLLFPPKEAWIISHCLQRDKEDFGDIADRDSRDGTSTCLSGM